MRSYLLAIFLLCLIRENSNAQENKRNNIWAIGYLPAVLIDFKDTIKIDTTKVKKGLSFGASNISDTTGNLLFFCNGFFIAESSGTLMQDGDSINTPLGLKLLEYYHNDGFWDQMSIILPKKGNTYYVFTTGMSNWAFDAWKKPDPPFDFRFDVLSYHIVDMDANNGKGKVVERNKILMQEARLSHNRMTAVKHANGRDWWLVKPHQSKQIFYTFLVKPDTIEGPFEQYGNLKMDTTEYQFGIFGIRGQCCFSPDGNYFACTEGGYTGAQLFKFDRCNGSISDYHFFKQVSFDTTVFDYSVGVCFSPDSKLLYLISGSNVFQYEIKDTTKTSGIHISGMDTIPQFFPLYSLSYLGPDNKLYIGNKNGTQKGMSYIDKPNERGLACDYRPKGLRQPFTNLQVPPNLPFYGLGVLKGSLCDTIKPPSIPVSEIKIYPNPTSEKLTLEFPQNIQNAEITIFNMLGQQVYLSSNSQILNNKMEFSVSHLARALYSIKIVTDGEQFVGKFVRE